MREHHTPIAAALPSAAVAELCRWESDAGQVLGRLLFDVRTLTWSLHTPGSVLPYHVPVECELLERARSGRPARHGELAAYRRERQVWWSTVEVAIRVSRADAALWALERIDEDSPRPVAASAVSYA